MAFSHQKTSFSLKSKQKTPTVKGTIPSLHNNLLLTSTGIPTIDDFIGCVPVGSVLLLEEDSSIYNNEVLIKCFIAEGVACEHDILLAGVDIQSILQSLPSPVVDSKVSVQNPPSNDELKIAWRYEKNTNKNIFRKYRIGHSFQMNKSISSDLLDKVNINTFNINERENSTECPYRYLLNKIKLKLEDGFIVSNDQIPNKILRIVINGIGSPRWNCNAVNIERETLKFLYNLRFLLRSAMAVCLFTFPTHLVEDHSFISKLRNLSDTVIKLESFASSTKEISSTYKDYLGLFSIEKLPALNSLTSHHPEYTRDLVFKISRKRFIVERLHLPPLDAEEPRVQNYCASKPGSKKSIDF